MQLDVLARLEFATSMLEELRTLLREENKEARYLHLLNTCDTKEAAGGSSLHSERTASCLSAPLLGAKNVDEAGYLRLLDKDTTTSADKLS